MAQLALWTHRDRYHRRDGVEWPLRGPWDRTTLRQSIATWVTVTTADTAVFVDIPPGAPDSLPLWSYDVYHDIGRCIDESHQFVESSRTEVPGRARITIWRRRR